MTRRTARTRQGQEVYINTTWKVDGGWEGYVLHANGFAVLVFIPGRITAVKPATFLALAALAHLLAWAVVSPSWGARQPPAGKYEYRVPAPEYPHPYPCPPIVED